MRAEDDLAQLNYDSFCSMTLQVDVMEVKKQTDRSVENYRPPKGTHGDEKKNDTLMLLRSHKRFAFPKETLRSLAKLLCSLE